MSERDGRGQEEYEVKCLFLPTDTVESVERIAADVPAMLSFGLIIQCCCLAHI